MTPKEALALLDRATALATLNRSDTLQVLSAITILSEYIAAKEQAESEKAKPQ